MRTLDHDNLLQKVITDLAEAWVVLVGDGKTSIRVSFLQTFSRRLAHTVN